MEALVLAFIALYLIASVNSRQLKLSRFELVGQTLLGQDPRGCDQGTLSSLSPWQRALIGDSDTSSVFGHLCWDTSQGASHGHAQSLWILGVKALSNFQYDLSKVGLGRWAF